MIPTLIILFLLQSLVQPKKVAGSSVIIPFPSTDEGTPSNLLVTSSGVFITIKKVLIHFDANNISHLKTFNYDFTRKYISKIIATDDSEVPVLVCSYDGSCYFHFNAFFNEGLDAIENVAIQGAQSSLFKIAQTFYIASGENMQMQISRFQWDEWFYFSDPLSFMKIGMNTNFTSRKFLHTFLDDDFVYFIAMDNSTNLLDRGIKLMRVCHNAYERNANGLGGIFESKLDCGNVNSTSIISFSKLNKLILLGINSGPGKNSFCMFNITEVNNKISQTYNECYAGDYTFRLPWSTSKSISCRDFSRVSIPSPLFWNV